MTLGDMLVGMLWTPLGGSDRDASPAPRSTALLERMRRYALEHLHDPGLGPEQLARAHFVSTRYVHKLFAASGAGVAAWIATAPRSGRGRPPLSDASIAAIAGGGATATLRASAGLPPGLRLVRRCALRGRAAWRRKPSSFGRVRRA